MSKGDIEVFSLNENADAPWAHGRLYGSGLAHATASFNRGLDLSAGVDIKGGFGANSDIGDGMAAEITGGGRATAGLALQAALPIDLFDAAGVVVRFRAQAAASGFLQAKLSLKGEALTPLLRDHDLVRGAWLELVDIFVDEIEFGAALWAQAGVSAQLLGEAAFVGSFLPTLAGEKAGFTCSFQYAMGFYYGAGVNVRMNFDLPSPQRLIDRLGTQFTKLLDREIVSALPRMSNAERTAAEQARPLLRMVLPLAFRELYEIGHYLSRPAARQKTASAGALVQGFLREAQEILARALLELAFSKMNALLQSDAVTDAIATATGQDATNIKDALTHARGAIVEFQNLDVSTKNWFDGVLRILDHFAGLVTLIADADPYDWYDNLALAWSAAAVINQIIGWTDSNTSAARRYDLKAVIAAPTSGALSQYIINQVPSAAQNIGKGLTLETAINYLSNEVADRLGELEEWVPSISSVTRMLTRIFDSPEGKSLLKMLFQGYAVVSDAQAAALLPKILAGISPIVEDQILPHLFAPLEQLADESVAQMVRQIIKPTVLSLTRVVLPKAATDLSSEAGRILREQVSAILLQSLTRLLLAATDILCVFAATEGPPAIRDLASNLRNTSGGLTKEDGIIAGISLLSGLPPEWTLTREDVADLMDYAVDTLVYWNEHERKVWLDYMGQLMTIGLVTGDDDLDKLWQSIEESDPKKPVPAFAETLTAFANRLAAGVWELVKLIGPRLPDLVIRHFKRLAALTVAAFKETILLIVDAVKKATEWLSNEIKDLEVRFNQLVGEVKAAAERIAEQLLELTDYLTDQSQVLISAVHDEGWRIVHDTLFANIIFQTLPDGLENTVIEGVHAAYTAMFQSLQGLLSAPIQILRSVTQWIKDALREQTQAGTLTTDAVLDRIRNLAQASIVPGLSLPILYQVDLGTVNVFGVEISLGVQTIDLGTILFPGHAILAVTVDMLLRDQRLRSTIDSVVASANEQLTKMSQLNVVDAQLSQALSQPETEAAVKNLAAPGQLEVAIVDPSFDGRTFKGSTDLKVVLRGANRTFVTGVQGLGVPPRVKLLINGNEHHYAPDGWMEEVEQQGDVTRTILVFRAKFAPPGAQVAPLPLRPPARLLAVAIQPGIQLSLAATPNGVPQFVLSSTTPQPAPESTPQPVPATPIEIHPIPSTPIHLPVEMKLPLERLEQLQQAIEQQPRTVLTDPVLGIAVASPPNVQSITPLVAQQVELFSATLDEQKARYRWLQLNELTEWAGHVGLSKVAFPTETIYTRPGVNRIDVFVVDGEGKQSIVESRLFFMAPAV